MEINLTYLHLRLRCSESWLLLAPKICNNHSEEMLLSYVILQHCWDCRQIRQIRSLGQTLNTVICKWSEWICVSRVRDDVATITLDMTWLCVLLQATQTTLWNLILAARLILVESHHLQMWLRSGLQKLHFLCFSRLSKVTQDTI